MTSQTVFNILSIPPRVANRSIGAKPVDDLYPSARASHTPLMSANHFGKPSAPANATTRSGATMTASAPPVSAPIKIALNGGTFSSARPMTTTSGRNMLTRLAQGDDKVEAATFAFRTYAFAMLAGTLVTIAGFVPVGFAASGAGEYTFSLFAVVTIALIASWFVAVLFAPLLGVAILKPPKAAQSLDPGWVFRTYRTFLTWALRAKWLTIAFSIAMFVASIFALRLIPNQFFPSSDRPELLVDMHRIAVIGSGTLDSLPHNGAVVTLLAVCGSTHRKSYFDIVMANIAGPVVALVVVIILGSMLGSF